MNQDDRLRSGFTLRSILALVLASAIFLPVNIFLSLISGVSVAAASVYIIAILFVELSALLGSPMSKQEIFIVYIMAGLAAGGVIAGGGGTAVFLYYIFKGYYTRSYITRSIIDPFSGKSLSSVIPSFWAPPPDSPAYTLRSFLHPDWVFPIIIGTVQGAIIWIIQEVALAMLAAKLYVEAEDLPFPFAEVNAQLVLTLSEREEKRMRYFVTSATLGTVYGILVFGLPIMSFGVSNQLVQIIPLPWADFTTGYFGIEQIMPGAILGLATDPLTWLTGFLLPTSVVVYMLLGSIACWTFGNFLALTFFNESFPLWAAEWHRGMDLSLVWQRSYFRVWAYPQVGFVLSLATLTLAMGYKTFIRAFKPMKSSVSFTTHSIKGFKTGFPSNQKLLLIFIIASIASVILFQWLIPDFPIWVSILTIPIGFVMTIAGTRARGETGQVISMSYLWPSMVILSGYPAADAFFFSPTIGGSSAPLWVEGIKTAFLTDTKPIDLFKAYILTVVLYHVFSFIYVSFFWAMAPIPSSQYPYTLINWPIQVISQNIWVSRQIAAAPLLLAGSYLCMTAIGVLGQIVSKFTGIPFSFASLVTGTTIVPPYPIAMFLGNIIGNYGIAKFLGKENFNNYKSVIVAGVVTGAGVVAGIAGAIVVIQKSIWMLPF
ncbi:MAG: OPT/YSL family transporter [Thermoproteota archaeon]